MGDLMSKQKTPINPALSYSRDYMIKTYAFPENFDFKIRDFRIQFKDGFADGFLIFFDGLSNQDYINRDILNALFRRPVDLSLSDSDRTQTLFKQIMTIAPLTIEWDYETAIDMANFGNCVVFIDGCDGCFVADVKDWNKRGVSEPLQESSLSGPQEAFNETILSNVAAIRKILKTSDLIAENIPVGNTSKTPCALMYLRGITNDGLLSEVRRRLQGIDTEYIYSSSDIEMLMEKHSLYPMTHTLKTERPDRAAAMLADGKVIVIVQGSPFVLILPTTAADLIEASEDNYVRAPEANFMRLVRLFGLSLCLLLPAIFVAIMLYHHEMLPTDLLLAIEASREKVPFPLVAELLLMEFSFELIKEASVRVPSPVGSTLGIIGGLILGQAAVEANIVSPILIIIVSIGGIGSFATPSVALSRSLSLLRFVYILFAAAGGFLGLICGLFINLAYLSASDSFGVPFLSPIAPHNGDSVLGSLFVKPIWKKEMRPKNLAPKDPQKQPHISRKWEK